MTPLDRLLQLWRVNKAAHFIRPGARVLDVGCSEQPLFARFARCASGSMGIDPLLPSSRYTDEGWHLIRGSFPEAMRRVNVGKFDVIVMAAVLEHYPENAYSALCAACADLLVPGGRLVITVPAPSVDTILTFLRAMRLVHGMAFEEHHGFEVSRTWDIFAEPQFRLLIHERFQFGLNNLFAFERTEIPFQPSRRLNANLVNTMTQQAGGDRHE